MSAQARPAQARELVAGTFLVSADGLRDPNFFQTVVLLIADNKDGTAGIVLNRRTETPLAKVLPGLDLPPRSPAVAFAGGPVEPARARALVRFSPQYRNAYRVMSDVALLDTRDEMRESLSAGAGPDQVRVYVGYAGWGAGQLEREILAGVWHVLDGDSKIVFDPAPDTLWRRQIRRTELRSAAVFP